MISEQPAYRSYCLGCVCEWHAKGLSPDSNVMPAQPRTFAVACGLFLCGLRAPSTLGDLLLGRLYRHADGSDLETEILGFGFFAGRRRRGRFRMGRCASPLNEGRIDGHVCG